MRGVLECLGVVLYNFFRCNLVGCSGVGRWTCGKAKLPHPTRVHYHSRSTSLSLGRPLPLLPSSCRAPISRMPFRL
jgi:hypothetical protein